MQWILAILIVTPLYAKEKRPERQPASLEREEIDTRQDKKQDNRYQDQLYNQVNETLINAQEEER